MSDLHDRLMDYATACLMDRRESTTQIAALVREGADEIKRLRTENSAMRKALEKIVLGGPESEKIAYRLVDKSAAPKILSRAEMVEVAVNALASGRRES